MKKAFFSSPRGMKDIFGKEAWYFKKIFQSVEKIARSYSFEFIETPIVEEKELFLRTSGLETDLGKEMYFLAKRGQEELVLRPEGTAPICRAYIENGMISLPHPVKLYYFGPFFRYERPQKAREREFHQFGFEILGAKDPFYDALSIVIFLEILKLLKIKKFFVKINSIGCKKCRKKYILALKKYYRPFLKLICKNCQKRFERNPLRILDCKEEKCQVYKKAVPVILDYLCPECKTHFKAVLEILDELKIPYILDHTLVRGLDYYNRTVFEVFLNEREFEGLSLGGGGRYDNLIKELGGNLVPAVGFGAGVERIIFAMKFSHLEAKKELPEIFLIALGKRPKEEVLKIWSLLRKAGFRVQEAIEKESISAQLKAASRAQAKFALIIGEKEVIEEKVILKDMENGLQEEIPQKKLIFKLKGKIK